MLQLGLTSFFFALFMEHARIHDRSKRVVFYLSAYCPWIHDTVLLRVILLPTDLFSRVFPSFADAVFELSFVDDSSTDCINERWAQAPAWRTVCSPHLGNGRYSGASETTLWHFRFVFHDKEANPISKTSYALHLKRACDRHNIEAINNLAFRIAFISRLIEKDLSPANWALILGHAVQINEHHYSVSDKCRLESIKRIIQ